MNVEIPVITLSNPRRGWFRRGLLALCVAWSLGLLVPAAPTAAATATQPKTIFDYIPRAWAVGTMTLGRPTEYRDGRVLAFFAVLDHVSHSQHPNPKHVLLVFDVPNAEEEAPLQEGNRILAPLGLLPNHSYWRENLPNVSKHQILGGLRNVFRDEDIEPVAGIVAAYSAALKTTGEQGDRARISILIDALASPVVRLREDAVRSLSGHPQLGSAFPEARAGDLAAFLASEAPARRRAGLIQVIGSHKILAMAPGLEKLSMLSDEVGVASLGALDAMGRPRDLDTLRSLTKDTDTVVAVYAYEHLAARIAESEGLLEEVRSALTSGTSPQVRRAIVAGLGRSGQEEAVPLLVTTLALGDQICRQTAAALAAMGRADAVDALKDALLKGSRESAVAAAVALQQTTGCSDCGSLLLEQSQKHPIPEVRQTIALVLALPSHHEH